MSIRVTGQTIWNFLIFIAIASSAFSAKEPPKKRILNPAARKVVEYSLPETSVSNFSGSLGKKSPVSHSLGTNNISSSPGLQIGQTYYDLQHSNTTGRMVGTGKQISGMDTTTFVHYTWMSGGLPSPAGRTGAYLYADLGNATFSSAVELTSGYAGFFNLEVTSDNRAVISGHYASDGNTSHFAPTAWYDSAALAGNFIYVAQVSDIIWQYANPYTGDDATTLWPHLGFQTLTDGSHVTHLTGVTRSGGLGPYVLYYYRKHGNTADLSQGELSNCPSLAVTGWNCPYVYDTAWATVALVTASKQSGKVALTWTANLPDYLATPGCDTCSVNSSLGPLRNIYENDIYYQESNDYGVTWNPMQNVTHMNSVTAKWMPYNDIDALWDESDKLHIAWVVSNWERYQEEVLVGYGARIYHWQEDFGNSIADTNAKTSRVAVQRRDDPILCNAGSFNLNLAKPQMGKCHNNLYMLFVDLWDGHSDPQNPDCSKSGYDGNYTGTVNGELMVSISDDNGVSFDLPHNLTETPTPACDSVGGVVGPCDSDHWPSMPPNGFVTSSSDGLSNWVKINPRPEQSYPDVPGQQWLPLMYINDGAPGVNWSTDHDIRESSVRTFLMACVDPDQISWGPEPCFGLGPDIGWPTFVLPGQQKDIIRVLENYSNSPLTYNITTEEDDGPVGWLGISKIQNTIAPGVFNKDTVTIHLNKNGIIDQIPFNYYSVFHGRILLEDVESFSVCTTNVELIVVNQLIDLVRIDTVSTGVISLAVANNGQFGLGGDGGQQCVRMDYFCSGDCDTVDSIPGDTRYYLYDGSIIVGGIVNGDTILSQQIFSQGFQQESSIYPLTLPTGPTIDGVVQYWQSGILTNHDTTLGMEITYCAPQVTMQWGTQAGKTWYADQQFITREFKVWSYDGQPHDSLAVGEVIDWDIPSDSLANNHAWTEVPKSAYFQGTEYDLDNTIECQENTDRYGGMSFGYFKKFNSITGKWSIVDSVGYGSYYARNSQFVYPGWNDNQLFNNMANSSAIIEFPDTGITDFHGALTYIFNHSLEPNDTLVFYAVLATVRNESVESPGPNLRIKDLTSKAQNFANYFGCCHGTRGDVNGDGDECNILDLTVMVDRVFRGGPSPTCKGEADVNSDKSPGDILDLTFLIDRIFRGGPAPMSCGSPPTI